MSKRRLYTNFCKICGKIFRPFSRNHSTCSLQCGKTFSSQNRRKRATKICVLCGVSFVVKFYRAEKAKYCSRRCWSHRNPPISKTCPQCKVDFDSYDRRAKFCSHSCRNSFKTGPAASAWKNGNSLTRERSRLSVELALWRKTIFERDHFTCQHCHQRKNRLHAHHLKSFAEYPELRLDINNGTTLCIHCHGTMHNKNFHNNRIKVCAHCGKGTKGRSKNHLCRSCAAIETLNHKKQLPYAISLGTNPM